MNSKYSGNLELFGESTSSMYLYVKLNCWVRRVLPALMRLCTKSASNEYKNKSVSNGAQLVPTGMPIVFLKYPSAELHKDVVNEIVQHLYDICLRVLLWCIRVVRNEVSVCVTEDNILKTTVTTLAKEAMVDNFL